MALFLALVAGSSVAFVLSFSGVAVSQNRILLKWLNPVLFGVLIWMSMRNKSHRHEQHPSALAGANVDRLGQRRRLDICRRGTNISDGALLTLRQF
jgi:hypothetical protein